MAAMAPWSCVLLAFLSTTVAHAQQLLRCSCANASLCRPLPRGAAAAKVVRVYSDCGGPTQNPCDWRAFDWAGITEISRMAGHQLLVSSDGSVTINKNPNVHSAHGLLLWPESELVCYAHAHGVRVLATVLGGQGAGGFNDAPPLDYSLLMSNASAVARMADGLAAAVTSAGFDGLEFDFESIQRAWPVNSSFDIGAAYVAMIRTTKVALRTAQPHGTVSLSIAPRFDTPRRHAEVEANNPSALAEAADALFIMGYDFHYGGPRYEAYEAGRICAWPNAPLSALTDIVSGWVQNGTPAEKLILGIPWYGRTFFCNSSLTPSSYAPCANSTCVTGSPEHLAPGRGSTAPGFWAIEQNETSLGCTKHWDVVAGSPYIDCGGHGGGGHGRGGHGDGAVAHGDGAAHSQTWYDDARSTALKVALARQLGLGGVGVFTGEAVGSGAAAQRMWGALTAFRRPPPPS
jgi:hypothetical protein